MGSFYEFVATLKDFLHIMFLKFPLIVTGTLMILGLVSVNTAYLWVGLGTAVLFFGVFILQLMFELLLTTLPNIAGPFTVSASSVCNILTTTGTITKAGNYLVTPSYWVSFLFFFITYTFRNALQVFNKPPGTQATADPDTLNNRKFQSGLTIALLLALGLSFMTIRMFFTRCETWLGAVLGAASGTAIGYYWFEFLVNCGEDRTFDLFGILGRIMPATTTAPQACIYNPND